MSDDLFGKKGPNDDPEQNKDEEERPLEDVDYSSIHLCAGNIISPDAYKTLMGLSLLSFNKKLISETALTTISVLTDLDTSPITTILDDTEERLNQWENKRPASSPQELEEIFNNFSDGIRKFLSKCHRLLEQERPRSEQQDSDGDYETESWQEDYGDGLNKYKFGSKDYHNPLDEIHYQSVKLGLSVLEATFDLLVPQHEAVCATNIGAVFNAINPECTVTNDVIDALSDEKDGSLANLIKILNNNFLLSDKQLSFYTTISPHLLRSLVLYINSAVSFYLKNLEQKPLSKDEFISALENHNKPPLSSAFSDPAFNIRYKEEHAFITWEIPALLADEAEKNKYKLVDLIEPIKNLLGEIGGSLSIDVIDGNKIVAKMGLPHQEAPELSEKERSTRAITYSSIQGCLPLNLAYPPVLLPVYHKDGEPFNLILLNESSIDTEEKRKNLTALLNVIVDFKFGASLTDFIPPREQPVCSLHFNKQNDTSTFHLCDKFIFDKGFLTELSNLIELNLCQHLSFLEEMPYLTPQDLLKSIFPILKKAKELNDERIAVSIAHLIQGVQSPRIEIQTPDQKLIGRIYYFKEETGNVYFGGRLCSRELTNQVVDIFDSIITDRLSREPKTNLMEFLHSDFYTELKKRGIDPSSNYIKFQNSILTLGSTEKRHHVMTYTLIRAQIGIGDVTIEKNGDRIQLDSANPLADKPLEDYVKKHRIL